MKQEDLKYFFETIDEALLYEPNEFLRGVLRNRLKVLYSKAKRFALLEESLSLDTSMEAE